MIDIPIHNQAGEAIGNLQVDEATLGGEVRPNLIKQAYVRYHANRRQGSANGRSRGEVNFSTRKLYRQKGTGNARRGAAGTNLMRKGGQTFAKKPKSWRMDMPDKMRRLANRNALLAKIIDGEVKIIEQISFEKPSTGQFAALLEALKIDRTCLVALSSTQGPEARSAVNLEKVTLIRGDHINAFDLLNHHFLLVEKDALVQWLARPIASVRKSDEEAA